ncbi:hypothetical protein CR513_43488, partial [Mucuna pruriens]
FKRLFANSNDAKNLTWHVDESKCGGQLRHATDSMQWEKIDRLFSDFNSELRNLTIGLATNGMKPYGNLSSMHSSWPVLLENDIAPRALTRDEVFEWLKDKNVFFDKAQKKGTIWKKANLLLSTILADIFAPSMSYYVKESRSFCECLKGINVPQGFLSLVMKVDVEERAQDQKSIVQNSGIMVVVVNTGVQTDELGFTLVDLDKVGYKGEPFIMASHAKQDKRKKGKEIQANNLHPYILSYRGYKALHKKLVAEKVKQTESKRVELNPSSVDITYHELWNRSRLKPSSNYTSNSSKEAIEKIDSLVEESTQGTFLPHGCEDTLTIAFK